MAATAATGWCPPNKRSLADVSSTSAPSNCATQGVSCKARQARAVRGSATVAVLVLGAWASGGAARRRVRRRFSGVAVGRVCPGQGEAASPVVLPHKAGAQDVRKATACDATLAGEPTPGVSLASAVCRAVITRESQAVPARSFTSSARPGPSLHIHAPPAAPPWPAQLRCPHAQHPPAAGRTRVQLISRL